VKASQLKGLPVVSMAQGAKIGAVRDVVFDAAQLRIAALVLDAGAGQAVLPFGSILGIGGDAVTVEDAASALGPAGHALLESGRRLDELKSLPLVEVSGKVLGQVRDVEVDAKEGRMTALDAHQGGVLGLGGTSFSVPIAQVRSIGAKLVTVDTLGQQPQPVDDTTEPDFIVEPPSGGRPPA
jgi:sporulation protein YlmC with PRC-barrel domain